MKRNLAVLLLLAGCSYPVSSANTVDARPHLAIANAPVGAQLTIDNVPLGDAAAFAPDKRVLELDHGTHHILITSGGTAIFDNNVYLADGTSRTIDLPQ